MVLLPGVVPAVRLPAPPFYPTHGEKATNWCGSGAVRRQHGRMAKAYWINTFRSVSDPDKLAAYVDLAGPAMRSSGGRFLARGMPAAAFESGAIERTTLIEFDDVDAAVAAYESPGYQEALRALGDGAERDVRIIEAVA
jgi:uncharacterized protein (DUF1330 family)